MTAATLTANNFGLILNVATMLIVTAMVRAFSVRSDAAPHR